MRSVTWATLIKSLKLWVCIFSWSHRLKVAMWFVFNSPKFAKSIKNQRGLISLQRHLACCSGINITLRSPLLISLILLPFRMSGQWKIKSYLNKPLVFMGRAFTGFNKWYGNFGPNCDSYLNDILCWYWALSNY